MSVTATELRAGVLRDARILVGTTGQSLDELARVIDGARTRMAGELFMLNDVPVTTAMARSVRRHVSTHLLIDDEYSLLNAYASFGHSNPVRMSIHGPAPDKLHSKALVADGSEAWISTAAPSKRLRGDGALDVSATFEGPAASALERLTNATMAGDSAAVRDAALAASQHGIVVNDPLHGVRLLTERVTAMIDSATDSIYVGTKVLDDRTILERLAAARVRGVRVLVETSHMSEGKWIDRARVLGLDAYRLPHSLGRMHANTVVVDGREAYVGTAMLTKRGLARATAKRPSRELGFVTDQPAAIADILHGFSHVQGSRLRFFTRPA